MVPRYPGDCLNGAFQLQFYSNSEYHYDEYL